MRRSAVVLVLIVAAARVHAQDGDSSRVPRDTVTARARQMVQSGKEAEGRKLVDSLLTTLTPDSSRYGEVLYWHGMLAATAADAERDYRRLLIEAPLSPRAEDALLQLAQLEQARGDRRAASDHLQRYLLLYPRSSARGRISVQLVRLLFDQGPQQLARACDVLKTAQTEIPATSVELRNQLEAQAPRCAYLEAQAPAPVDSARTDSAAKPAAPLPPASTVPPVAPPTSTTVAQPPPPIASAPGAPVAPASSPAAPAGPAFYSVQLAAYDAPESATRMVQQLVGAGIDARVDGAAPPFRVRVGRYTTRAEAVKAAADLKAKGYSGFITLVGGAR